MKVYDIAVIGAGPGGYVAAIRAAQAGACVALVEREKVGGTCLNHGCIPTKALYATARHLRALARAGEHGIQLGAPRFDLAQAMARKDGVVEKLVSGVEQLLQGNGVELFRGEGQLLGEGRVRVAFSGGAAVLQARKIIIATGSQAAIPKALHGSGKNLLTSREILAMKELPDTLAVIGGGYIGCELAGIFATFGSRVTIVEQFPALLGRTDRQAVREVERGFQELGVTVRTGTGVEGVDAGGLLLAGGERLDVDAILVATGRVPDCRGLGLEAIGVKTADGAVPVDAGMRTSHPDIYAIGDVTGGIQLAHVASHQATIAVANALGGEEEFDPRIVPSCIFTLPEIAQVGLTEEECKSKGIAVEVGRFAYQATSKALCDGESQGSIKLIAARDDRKLIGATIAGAEASSLIAEIAAALTAGMTAQQLGGIIHAHPTLPEMVMEAAEDVDGHAVHKVTRRRSAQPLKQKA